MDKIQDLIDKREFKKAFEILKPHINKPNTEVLKHLSIICYYIGEIDLGLQACYDLCFANHDLGPSNLFWYCKKLKSEEILQFKVSESVNKKNYKVSSTSLVDHKEGYLAVVRLVSYTLCPETGDYNGDLDTENVIVIYDKDFNVISETVLECPEFFRRERVKGMEDIRAIKVDEKIYISFTSWSNGRISLFLGELDENFQLKSFKKGVTLERCEKNWNPFIDKNNKLKYIYKYNDFSVYNPEDDSITTWYDKSKVMKNLRGSAPPVKYKDGWLSIGHFIKNAKARIYYHAFVYHDENMIPLKQSLPFNFNENRVEFTLSMLWKGDELLISHSTFDRECRLISVSKETIENMFK